MSETLFGLLSRHGIEVKENSSDPNEFSICCIFCEEMGFGTDFKFRLGFNIASGFGHCFHCSWKSRHAILKIVQKLGANEDDILAVRNTQFTKKTRERPKKVVLPEDFQLLDEIEVDDDLFGPAKKYALSRGITPKQLRVHEVGASCTDWFFGGRVLFPVRNDEGKLLGIVGRDWTGKQVPKYKNSVGTKVAWNCYPDKFTKKLGILAEGITKALAIERATKFKLCSMALNGNSITDTQGNQLKQFKEIVLFPDPGKPGVDGFLGVAVNLIAICPRITIAWPWPEKQADDLSEKEIRKLIRGRRLYNTLLEWEVKRQFKDIL